MNRTHTGYTALAFVCASALISAQQQEHRAAAPKQDDAAMIRSAMSAAPMAVAKDATIVAMTPDGKMRTVRKGTNAYTCVPDDPGTPGPDPVCVDQVGMDWMMAYMSRKAPSGKVGVMFMLAGGSDASNTDPFARKPAPGSTWLTTGPHLMVTGPKGSFDAYQKGEKVDPTKPYVMFAGTPYEHLMVPVR
jgi:hypothetical protein